VNSTDLPDYHPFRSVEARNCYYGYYDKLEAECPLTSDVTMVHTRYAETLVRTCGPPDAPPLVIHPGTWAHSLDYVPAFVEPLAKSYRVYRIDDPWDLGRSVSTRPVGAIEDTMQWLDEVFDSLGLAHGINLLGTSKGAWRAAEYLLHAPERLASVTWLSPSLVVQRVSAKGALDGLRMIPVMLKPSARAVARAMRPMCLAFERADRAGFEQYVHGIAVGLECYARIPIDARARVLSNAELGDIRTPVLYMAGEHETLSSVPAAVSRLHRVAPQIEVAVFPGAGHDLISLQPAAIATRMLQFLGARSA